MELPWPESQAARLLCCPRRAAELLTREHIKDGQIIALGSGPLVSNFPELDMSKASTGRIPARDNDL